MSVINKKPFIKSVLETLTQSQLNKLVSLVDGGAGDVLVRCLDLGTNKTRISNADKGVNRCNLEIGEALYDGYLIFNDSYCVFISYQSHDILTVLEINADKTIANSNSEGLTIDMLRCWLGSVKPTFDNVDIEDIDSDILENLHCGDIVIKRTVEGDHKMDHAYIVTYKEEHVGICLSYFNAGYGETVSYDWDVDDKVWKYNSTDKATY